MGNLRLKRQNGTDTKENIIKRLAKNAKKTEKTEKAEIKSKNYFYIFCKHFNNARTSPSALCESSNSHP